MGHVRGAVRSTISAGTGWRRVLHRTIVRVPRKDEQLSPRLDHLGNRVEGILDQTQYGQSSANTDDSPTWDFDKPLSPPVLPGTSLHAQGAVTDPPPPV